MKNSVTQKTTAFFEPSLDYIVVKMPRWDIQKLKEAKRTIGSEMKSVGEVMAIGRSFPEALQKAVRMCGLGATSLFDYPHHIADPKGEIEKATDRRLFAIAAYIRAGHTAEEIHAFSAIDLWFCKHIERVVLFENRLQTEALTPELLLEAKKMGFSDSAIGKLTNKSEEAIRTQRLEAHITPFVKQIDTLAGEFDAKTNYLYLTYHASCHDLDSSEKRPIVV